MENASKALVIAGAILISILLIGLGVYVYTIASDTITQADLSGPAAQAQNSQFTSYFGDRVSAASVKNLMSAIRSNNISSQTAEEEKEIKVYYNGAESDTSTISRTVKPGKTYWVNTENDKAIGKEDATTSTAAYYNSGFLRIISVWEGSHGTATQGGNGD